MSETRALLLTDVVDSTRLSERLGDAATATIWAAHDRLARGLLPPHHGREIDKTDGMLLMFEQAADALRYARAYHEALASLSPPLQARAGLHVGPVLLRENAPEDIARGAKPLEVDGLAKPAAARVMALARGGQTLLSADALRALGPDAVTPGSELRSHGHWMLKGLSEPVELFEIGAGPFTAPADGDKAYRVTRVGERWLPVRQVPNNLPQQPTEFFGRERELEELKSALRGARLVTLLGMGGLGKTRLSLQVAAEMLAEFPDGAWFLDLSPLRDPALVVEEAARLLHVTEEPGCPLLQTLCARLRERRALLIVDNCEHLVEAAAAFAHALLRAAPDLRMMASSRTALRVPGERTYPVMPLPVPGAGADPAALARSTAVRLFVARAQGHRPGFELDAREAPQVAELVARLEGIPLALELAAARVRSMSVADINARLKDRYKLLTGGSRVLQQRQQTLRALVDWSYELLAPREQVLLQRLGLFIGGFDLAAAEVVCGAEPLDALDVLDLLDSLVENSLVMLDVAGGQTRYRMLETLREYAHEKLVAAGDADTTAARHAGHFFAVAKEVRDGLQGPEQAHWARRGEADLDNLRAAMAWGRGGGGGADPMLAAKLAVALQGFWVMRGRLSEGREQLRAVLELPAIQASAMARAHTLYVAAALAYSQGDAVQARSLLETCLALRRELQDPEVANTLSTLAMTLLAIGDAEAALAAEQEALDLLRRLGHRTGEAIGLLHLGQITLYLARWDEARHYTQRGLELFRALGNLEIEGECELLLGEIECLTGDSEAALAHLQRSLQLCREAGDRSVEAKAQAAIGRTNLQAGNISAAGVHLGQALCAYRDFEMRAELVEALEDHADLAARLGHDGLAARLAGAAEAARAGMALARAPYQQARAAQRDRGSCERMGPEAYARERAIGATWPLAQAVSAALAMATC